MSTLTQEQLSTYAVDPTHSRVGFSVVHMGFSKVRGSFEDYEATVRMTPDDLRSLEAEATIQVESITTNDEKRDAHLRSEDFFEAETYPTLTFRSTGVRDIKGDSFVLEGELTIRDVTRQVALNATYLGEGTDPWGGTRVAFEAKTKIDRKAFGLNWNAVLETGGLLVSKEVEILLELQAVEQA